MHCKCKGEMRNLPSFYADFHIHSPYSRATSKAMLIPNLVESSKNAGLKILGTGDILDSRWREHLKNHLVKYDEGVYTYKKDDTLFFVPTGEVEDNEGIHHLFFLPNIGSGEDLALELKKHIEKPIEQYGGRPIIPLKGNELVELVHRYNGLIGPAHAFTPFKSIFRLNRYRKLSGSYLAQSTKVDFIELGLSANSNMADHIRELWNYSFLTNSDSHSPHPSKIGRECNLISLNTINFDEIAFAIKNIKGRKIEKNIGLDPRLGKYYSSFCFKCRRRVKFVENEKIPYDEKNLFFKKTEEYKIVNSITEKSMRCPVCRGLMKLGVDSRIKSLATTKELNKKRVEYINIVPLAEIIATIHGIKGTNSKTVQKEYINLISRIDNEIAILTTTPIEIIEKENKAVGKIIKKMRMNQLKIIEGGGGIYGKLLLH